MQKDVLLTPEGLDKLKDEIEHLSTVKRREVAERIKEAREFGDISENSEYDDAKNEQAMLEARIASLEEKLRSASVIDASELDSDVVRVGSHVSVKDEGSGKSLKYTIVGSTEANPSENRLSNESPVGKGLLGRKKGDTVKVQLPNGKIRELKITKIDVGERARPLPPRRRRGRDPRRQAAQARGAARRRHRPVPARVRRRHPDRAGARGPRRPRARRRDRDARARRRPPRRAARPGQGDRSLDLVDRSGRIQLLGRLERARRGGVRAAALARPRRHRSAPTARSSARAPAS